MEDLAANQRNRFHRWHLLWVLWCLPVMPVKAVDAEDALRAALILQSGSASAIERQVIALDRQFRVAPPGSEYHMRLTAAVARLDVVNGRQLRYAVYLSSQVNALAFPNGEVRVFAGLMEILDDDELTFVIGHEIAHVVKAHGMSSNRRYKARELSKLAGELLGVDVNGSTAQGAQAAVGALDLHFSRTAELEADRFGQKLLQVLGRNKRAGVTALTKLAVANGSAGRVASWFQTHPDPIVRAQKLDELIGP